MATPTTVREALATAIAALTPTSLPTELFVRYRDPLPFADFIVQAPAHCFRRFTVRFEQNPLLPAVTNGSAQGLYRYPFVVEVAYPPVHYKTLTTPLMDLDQVIDEDTQLIIPVLRDYASATLIAVDATIEREADAALVARVTGSMQLTRP